MIADAGEHTPTGIRMPRSTLHLVAALACVLAALVGPTPASAQWTRVAALAGQVAPDTGGGTYASFGFVDVDIFGDVVFSAAVSGGTAPGGLFTVSQPPNQGSRAIAGGGTFSAFPRSPALMSTDCGTWLVA